MIFLDYFLSYYVSNLIMSKLEEILNKDDFQKEDIIYLLSLCKADEIEGLRQKAIEVLKTHIGSGISLRGLIEFSNLCSCDCYYCGIRKSNSEIERYTLNRKSIFASVREVAQKGFGSIVLQSGEMRSNYFTKFVTDCISEIKELTTNEYLPKGLGITLCCGEQDDSTYKEWFDAGAHRYLLRIESSNEILFNRYHPPSQLHSNRLLSLKSLKSIGYQTGTGVIIGLPDQSVEDLANDVIFFRDMDIDMIGMGPYIHHDNNLLSFYKENWNNEKNNFFSMSLKMIAVARIVLKDVNIASTSALDAINKDGRELGLNFGANVIMPLMTPNQVSGFYNLYDGKKIFDTITSETLDFAEKMHKKYGRIVNFGKWGDAPHFYNR